MTYEALPEIPEVDLSSIKLDKLVVKADDAAVDEALGNLAETAQDFEPRKAGTKAKDGDQIVFDFLGKVDGEAFEGGAAEDYPLVLGSNSFIPGFEEQLVGAVTGDEKNVTVSFPEDYQAPHLAGKEATFECKIKEVKKPVPAKIDDELAKKFGAEDLAALKTQISERLEAEYAGAARAVMKRGLLDELDKLVSFDEHKTLAERRVRLGLLLAELGQKAEVQVTDAEMTQAIMSQARQYPGQERQFFEFVQQNQQMQQQMRAPLFEDKVVDHVFEQATLTEKEVSKEDLQKAVESLEDE